MRPIILAGDSQRAYAKQCIDTAKPMSVVSIREGTRSDLQNDLMWALIGDIMKHPSNERPHWSPESWKCGMMQLCGHEIRWDQGLGGCGPLPIGYRSSKLTIPQMTALIECIYNYGAERGVVFREPRINQDDAK